MLSWFSLTRAGAACWLFLGVSSFFALNLQRAATSTDTRHSGDVYLLHLNQRLDSLYKDLLPQLTINARTQLRVQQKAWIAKRDQMCANGNTACLQKVYGDRIDQLSALDAESRVTDNKIASLALPFTVLGTWKATLIRDPLGTKPASEADLHGSLDSEDLPEIGKLVTASPGRVCVEGQDCRFMAWKRTTVSKVVRAEALERVLGLNPSAPVLVGDTGAQEVPGLMLLPQGNGVIWAIFLLNKSSIHDGNYAIEVWSPAAGRVGDPTQP